MMYLSLAIHLDESEPGETVGSVSSQADAKDQRHRWPQVRRERAIWLLSMCFCTSFSRQKVRVGVAKL